ncbi:MAG: hypothetical protein RSD06_05045 [Bacilli bacterium]
MSVKVLNDFMRDFGHLVKKGSKYDKKFNALKSYKKIKESM